MGHSLSPKILFIDLEAIEDTCNIPDISEALKSWRGFVAIGLAAPANVLNISSAIADQFDLIKSIPKIKEVFIPFEDGSGVFEVLNNGEAKRSPNICKFDFRFAAGGMVEYYMNKYLTRPDGWLVSDRPKEQTPADICGLTYISGADWRGDFGNEDF